jgi:hypothetical protein
MEKERMEGSKEERKKGNKKERKERRKCSLIFGAVPSFLLRVLLIIIIIILFVGPAGTPPVALQPSRPFAL